MEREVFPRLAEENRLFGHKVEGLWIDIGKPEEYLQTNKMLLENYADKQHKNHEFTCKAPVAMGKGVSIGENSVIGPFVILGKNVIVGKNVQIHDSVVFEDAKIDDDAVVEGALIGEGARIGKKAKVTAGCIIADQAKVKDGVLLQEKEAVCPGEEV